MRDGSCEGWLSPRNYEIAPLDNKMLTSTEHIDVFATHDKGCDLRRARISLVTASFCHGDNSMLAA